MVGSGECYLVRKTKSAQSVSRRRFVPFALAWRHGLHRRAVPCGHKSTSRAKEEDEIHHDKADRPERHSSRQAIGTATVD
jgi:hypothetical protein